jgi:hypothetical protein
MIWLTIDVEDVTDMNFKIQWKKKPEIDYEKTIDSFIELGRGQKATAFVLGSFAQKYPHLIKRLSESGIEIGCHGFNHNLIYTETFEQWLKEIKESKRLLEEMLSKKVVGYRSVNWSMPFEKEYYEELVKMGFEYSSSYFPMKNYMYGNKINKKEPFTIYTDSGNIEERPVVRDIIPFCGGFYLRVLPLWVLKYFFKKTKNPTLYIHPYELIDANLLSYFQKYASFNLDYFLAFYVSSLSKNKIKEILTYE